MEARATLRGARISTNVVITFIVALLAAFLLGGAGGYLVRVVTIHPDRDQPSGHRIRAAANPHPEPERRPAHAGTNPPPLAR